MLHSKLNGYLRILWKKSGINHMFNHYQKSNQNNQENKREALSSRLLPQQGGDAQRITTTPPYTRNFQQIITTQRERTWREY
jgi:hypothetical protein